MQNLSELQKARLTFKPEIAKVLQDLKLAQFVESSKKEVLADVAKSFPNIKDCSELSVTTKNKQSFGSLSLGVVFSGGQAAGGHNVITGIFDAIKALHPESRLFGFLNGPKGIIQGKYVELSQEKLEPFRNQGGFDLIGSGRDKIETPTQFEEALKVVSGLDLDGLVIIGGDDSNTNAAFLAEFFLQKGVKTKVIGVPKTIDGDLQNERVAISFGFDTACKIYAETIGNISRDALSAKKYYYFVKLMGRSASHITLECALKSEPNLALIGEEIEANGKKLSDVVSEISDLICQRADQEKDFGTVLIPEGIIEFLADVKGLIQELNKLLAKDSVQAQKLIEVEQALSESAKSCLKLMPEEIQLQLLMDRDSHGNVQVSKIETERLFIALVQEELKKRKEKGSYKGKFSPQPIFCGYEGRAALPSNFDATYCYNLGRLAALLIAHKKTGYMAALTNLHQKVQNWEGFAVPLASLIHFEERSGKQKAVIKKELVDLNGKVFKIFALKRDAWRLQDSLLQSGPIQFFGLKEITDTVPFTISL